MGPTDMLGIGNRSTKVGYYRFKEENISANWSQLLCLIGRYCISVTASVDRHLLEWIVIVGYLSDMLVF